MLTPINVLLIAMLMAADTLAITNYVNSKCVANAVRKIEYRRMATFEGLIFPCVIGMLAVIF